MHLGFRNSWNQGLECDKDLLWLPFLPLSKCPLQFQLPKTGFLYMEVKWPPRKPEIYKLWFPSLERKWLSSSLPLTESQGRISIGQVLTICLLLDRFLVVRVRQSHERTGWWLLSSPWLEMGKKKFPEMGNAVPGGGEGIGQKRQPRCALKYEHRVAQWLLNKVINSNIFKLF